MKPKKKNYFGIWNSQDILDEETFKDVRENIAECNDMKAEDVSDEEVYRVWNEYLADEHDNLNKELDGCIIAIADLGFWNGRVQGAMVIGTNLNSIFQGYSCEHHEWYADRYNVKGNFTHHDGTHHVTFRLAKDRDTALDLVHKYAYEGMTEAQIMRRTKSIRPYVAKIYGWKSFTKTLKTN